MKRIRPLVWAVDLWSLPIHAIASQSRRGVERVTFIRPPAVNSHREIFAVRTPVTTCLFFVEARQRASIVYGTVQAASENYGVQNSAKVVVMEFIENLFWIGENSRIPLERAVLSVPS